MADYQVIPDGPPAFAVKVTFPNGHGSTERGFRTEADASGLQPSASERPPAPRSIDQPDGNQAATSAHAFEGSRRLAPRAHPIYAWINTDSLIVVIGAALLVAVVVVCLLRGM
jgi:hypothetical protein